jgi:hypothetical protein
MAGAEACCKTLPVVPEAGQDTEGRDRP